MSISKKIAAKAFALSALTLTMNAALHADTAPVLILGETITVTGTTDGIDTTGCPTACPSLRSAVIYANGNANGATKYDLINLGAGTHTLTIAGTNEDAAADGDLDVSEGIKIVGAGVASTIIDGGGSAGTLQERIITAHAAQVDVSDLTMTNGFAKYGHGGAILGISGSSLSLTNCAVTNNTATWDEDYESDRNTLGVEGTPPDGIDGTVALPEGTIEEQGSGGAINTSAPLTIENCTFRGNTASTIVDTGVPDPDSHDGANFVVKVGNGGAINASDYTVINNSTFGSDVAIDADSNVGINGGALFLTGGHNIEITRSTFSFNDAISGGGICNVSPSAPTSITSSTISGNHVTDSGAGIETNAAMSLLNVTIANNVKDSSTKGTGLNTGPSVNITAQNVLFDNNMADSPAVSANCGAKGGSFNLADSNGGNISSDGTCDLDINAGDKEDVSTASIALAALADNNAGLSGTTFTQALPEASAAVDAGKPGCPNNDQRGSISPFNANLLPVNNCDSGAYELYIERTDLHIENMTAPQQAILGSNVTIVVDIDNGLTGAPESNPADAVVLTVTLPAQMTFVSATPSVGGACVNTSGVVTCPIGNMAKGATADVTVVATASSVGTDAIVNAALTTTSVDLEPLNNTQNVFIDIAEAVDLSITAATADPASVKVGSNSTVTVTVSNLGPNTAKGIELSGILPDFISFVQGVGCSETGGVLLCSVDDIAADASATVIFEVKGAAVGTAVVNAAVTTDQIDTDLSDNSGSVTIAVSAKSSSGGFCSYHPEGRFDPVLPGILLMAMAYLGFRRKQSGESNK